MNVWIVFLQIKLAGFNQTNTVLVLWSNESLQQMCKISKVIIHFEFIVEKHYCQASNFISDYKAFFISYFLLRHKKDFLDKRYKAQNGMRPTKMESVGFSRKTLRIFGFVIVEASYDIWLFDHWIMAKEYWGLCDKNKACTLGFSSLSFRLLIFINY